MKKLISIAILFAIMLSVFAACSGEEPMGESSLDGQAITESESGENSEASLEDSTEEVSEESFEESSEEEQVLTAEGFFGLCGQPYVSTGVTVPSHFTATETEHLYSLSLPLPEIEGMGTHVSGDNLFINYWDETDKGNIYSLKTGELLSEIDMPFWYSLGKLEDSGFWVADKSSLCVKLYDKNGKERVAYEGREANAELMAVTDVCVSHDGRFMLYFSEDKSTTVMDLSDGREKTVELDTEATVWGITYTDGSFVLSMLNDTFCMYNPYEDSVARYIPDSMCSVNDGVLDYSVLGLVLLGSFEDDRKLSVELDKTEHLQAVYGGYLAVGNIYNTSVIKFYDLVKGKLVSELSFDEDIYATNVVFKEDGTAFIIISSEKGNELYVYDVPSAAKNAEMDVGYLLCNDEEMRRLTYDIAAEIYENTGAELVYGSEGNDFVISDYVAQVETDVYTIYNAVNTVRDTLALYPDGMLREAWEDGYSGLRIYLCGTIYGVGGDSLSEAGAFVSDEGRYLVIVMDVTEDLATNLPHELSHVFDRRIGSVSSENALDWLWHWEAVAPGEDAYTFMYAEYESNMRYTIYGEDNPDNVWFIDGYSRVSPTEDRARIMEYLFSREDGTLNQVFQYENIKNKAVLYSHILRQCFPSCAEADTLYWEEWLGPIDESVLTRFG